MTGGVPEVDRSDTERLARATARRLADEVRRPVVEGGRAVAPGSHADAYATALEGLGLAELLATDGATDAEVARLVAIQSEEMGAGLLVAPLIEAAGPALLQHALPTLPAMPCGRVLLALGGDEAVLDDGVLTGHARRVPFATLAEAFIVQAHGSGGCRLVLVMAGDAGLRLQPTPLADGSLRGDLGFVGCRAIPLAGGSEAMATAGLLSDLLLLSTAAQLAGVARRAQQIAAEHLRTRHQFGRPLAAFQALQHRAADDFVAVEATRSFLYQLCDAWSADTRRTLLHALLAKTGRTAVEVAKSAIQCHGAMGFTAEHEIGWYLKSAIALASRYGSIAAHRRAYIEQGADLFAGEAG